MRDALHRNEDDFLRVPDHGNRFGDSNQGLIVDNGLYHKGLLSFRQLNTSGGSLLGNDPHIKPMAFVLHFDEELLSDQLVNKKPIGSSLG